MTPNDFEPNDHYPVVLIEDRYQGVYSGGRWLAVANADIRIEDVPRASWLLGNGPGGDDLEAAEFWAQAPAWIAVGSTPDEAVRELLRPDPASTRPLGRRKAPYPGHVPSR